MRPFFPYYGSTWNRARYLPAPQFPVVRESFAGGAGYSLFYDCPRVDLTDKDPLIAGLWAYLMRVTPAEIMALPDMREVGDSVDNYAIPQEARWLIGFWLNRGSAQPKKSRTAYSARSDKAQLNWGIRAKERIARQLPILAGWTITEGDYDGGPIDECTWLIDPPYVDKGKFYRVKFDGHAALGTWCRALPGQVIVLEGAGADWLPFRSLGDFKTSLGKSEEKVWVSGHAAIGKAITPTPSPDPRDDLLRQAMEALNIISCLKEEMIVAGAANSLVLRVPTQSLRKMTESHDAIAAFLAGKTGGADV